MYFVESKYGPYDRMIRRAMSRAMNLLLIASFTTGPASIVLSPTLSFAAPLPVPTWMTKIVDELKTGGLTANSIDTLKTKGAGSYKNLISIVERIDELAVQQNSRYSINIEGFYISNDPPTVAITITVVDQKTLKEVGKYKLGNAKYDVGKPMKNTSTDALMGDTSF